MRIGQSRGVWGRTWNIEPPPSKSRRLMNIAKRPGDSFNLLLALLKEECVRLNQLRREELQSHLIIEVLDSPLRNLQAVSISPRNSFSIVTTHKLVFKFFCKLHPFLRNRRSAGQLNRWTGGLGVLRHLTPLLCHLFRICQCLIAVEAVWERQLLGKRLSQSTILCSTLA